MLNVVLAECICDRALDASPESVTTLQSGRKALPDIVLSYQGVRLIIEGKSSNVPGATNIVKADALRRVESGIAQIAVGVVYPSVLTSTHFAGLKNSMSRASLEFTVISESNIPEWHLGTVDSLVDELRRVYDYLITDDVVARSVEQLRGGMDPYVKSILDSPTASERLAALLGVYLPDSVPNAAEN